MSSNNTEKSDNSQSKNDLFLVNKQEGETLASLLERVRAERSLPKEIPLTYAGRLDPMAEGLVLVLTGEMCKKKDEYLGLDKTYEFEVLFGVSTDTFDVLGLLEEVKEYLPSDAEIREKIQKIKQVTVFNYPLFSSKTVAGKPLFTYAKEGILPDELPTMKGEIKNLELKVIREGTFEGLIKNKIEIIKKVEGDFRQEEIITGWQNFLQKNKDKKCIIAKFEANVSSGVYIRTLATMLGGLAYSIKRIKIESF